MTKAARPAPARAIAHWIIQLSTPVFRAPIHAARVSIGAKPRRGCLPGYCHVWRVLVVNRARRSWAVAGQVNGFSRAGNFVGDVYRGRRFRLKIRHDCAPHGMGLQLASEGPQTRLERDGPAPVFRIFLRFLRHFPRVWLSLAQLWLRPRSAPPMARQRKSLIGLAFSCRRDAGSRRKPDLKKQSQPDGPHSQQNSASADWFFRTASATMQSRQTDAVSGSTETLAIPVGSRGVWRSANRIPAVFAVLRPKSPGSLSPQNSVSRTTRWRGRSRGFAFAKLSAEEGFAASGWR